MITTGTLVIGGLGDQLPVNPVDGTLFVRADGLQLLRLNNDWITVALPVGSLPAPLKIIANADGTTTLVVENLEVAKSFTAAEVYYQNLNGVNGAIYVAPSGRVRDFAAITDGLPPSGLMHDAENTTDSATRLIAKIEPHGRLNVWFYFEYGPTPTESRYVGEDFVYTSKTEKRIVIGTDAVPVDTVVVGLKEGTQYEARLVIESDSGTYRGNAVRFTTVKRVNYGTGNQSLDATNVTTSSAMLNGKVGTVTAQMKYFFKIWMAGSAYSFSTDLMAVPTNTGGYIHFTFDRFRSGTMYYTSLCLVDANGGVVELAPVQLTTLKVGSAPVRPTVGAVVMDEVLSEEFTAGVTIDPKGVNVTYWIEIWSTPDKVWRIDSWTPPLTSNSAVPFDYWIDCADTPPLVEGLSFFIQAVLEYYDTVEQATVKITGGTTYFTLYI